MAIDINAEVVRSYIPGSDVNTPDYNEVHNQQLNEALQAGTVEGILMKTGYVAQYDYNVVVKRDIAGFITRADLDLAINNASFNFGGYDENTRNLQVKHNLDFDTIDHPIVPSISQITKAGEIAIDNYDGSLYLRAYGKTHSNPSGTPSPRIVKVDAGTVNGYVVERDVLDSTDPNGGGILNKTEIVNLINGAFVYDPALNKLTIRKVSITDPV